MYWVRDGGGSKLCLSESWLGARVLSPIGRSVAMKSVLALCISKIGGREDAQIMRLNRGPSPRLLAPTISNNQDEFLPQLCIL